MTITRLTVHPLLHFGLCYRLFHEIFLRICNFRDYGVLCGFRAGAGGDGHHLAIDNPSASFIRVTDRDAIVE